MHTRRWIAALAVTPVVLIGCGSSDDSDGTDPIAAGSDEPTTVAPDTNPPRTEATADSSVADPVGTDATAPDATDSDPAATDPAATDPAATDPAASAAVETDAAGVGDVEVTMDEWLIEAPTDLPAGEVTFAIQNDGSFPHEFVVIEGDGYESLPLASNGAVLEEELPAGAIIDRTDRIPGGLDGSLTVDLGAGSYVLLCNIVAGPTSHAGRGQVLDVTVG